jgi:flavin-dependent thymidylate synthase
MNNTVELIGHYGSDEIHACSAWTSTSRDLTDDKRGRIPNVLKMLADHGHHTPFEKSSLHFLVDCDIASHIHLLKHRIGVSINGESARYKELKEDKYYIPDDWNDVFASEAHNIDMIGWNAEPLPEKEHWSKILADYTELGNKLYHECLKDLEPVLGRKRAKESARFFKTYNSQIQADVMFNWRSFAHAIQLRASTDAQKEIKYIFVQMLNLVENIEGQPFKHTIQAFRDAKIITI